MLSQGFTRIHIAAMTLVTATAKTSGVEQPGDKEGREGEGQEAGHTLDREVIYCRVEICEMIIRK